MDIHSRITAIAHIGLSAISLFIIFVFALALSGVFAIDVRTQFPDGFLKVGLAILAIPVIFAIAIIIASVAFLKGSPTGRVFLVVFGVLDIFAFPYGTVLGIYTLWALLRKQPISSTTLIPHES